jgi:hypothetical protein
MICNNVIYSQDGSKYAVSLWNTFFVTLSINKKSLLIYVVTAGIQTNDEYFIMDWLSRQFELFSSFITYNFYKHTIFVYVETEKDYFVKIANLLLN